MANLSQTAANVAPGSNSTATLVQAGESITQGMPCYLNSSDNKYYQCDANDTSAKADVDLIALTPSSTNGYFLGHESGQVNLGATLAVGQVYVVSATKGAICPYADLTTGDYVSILGIAITTALLDFDPLISGVQKP